MPRSIGRKAADLQPDRYLGTHAQTHRGLLFKSTSAAADTQAMLELTLAGSTRLSREQLLAELTAARYRIADLEAHSFDAQGQLIGSLAAHLRDGFALMTPEGVHLDVNPAFCEMTGFTREELVGRGLPLPYWPPELRDTYAAGWERFLVDGPHTLELVFLRCNGERFPVLLTPTILRDELGAPACMFATIKDVSEMKATEEALSTALTRQRRALEGTVQTLGRAIELRDPYTAGHQRRVAVLADAIAARLGWLGDLAASLHLASEVHDIGKISVPAEILAKPGRLSACEFALIRSHSSVGHDLLAPTDFGMPVAVIVLQHHERLDGSGYPRGLAGDEVLPQARVLAVADVVEAMVSHRPYRPALPVEQALAEIRDGAGTRYDHEVAKTCEELLNDGGLELFA
jgi:PAS domain S-box-containing protein